MKKAYPFLLFHLMALVFAGCQEQDYKEVYHKIEFTSSSVEMVQYNILDTSNTAFVQETIDDLGRTKELKFYNNKHELDWAGSGFYGGPIIKYDYEEDQIIETFFSSETEIANDFRISEVPFRFIYHLDDQNRILRIEMIYKIDFEWTNESLNNTIDHLEFYKQSAFEGTALNEVFGYTYSIAKMDGINPRLK
jgi:hypothetical protein